MVDFFFFFSESEWNQQYQALGLVGWLVGLFVCWLVA